MPAYYDEEESFHAGGGDGRGGRGLSRILGAVAAIAVIGGGGYMAWNLGSQEADEVPVIRAAAGPAKTQPENAGGAETRHTDISAFDVAEGSSDATAEVRDAPAPGAPTDEDRPMSQVAAVAAVQPPTVGEAAAEGASTAGSLGANLGFGPGSVQSGGNFFATRPARPSSEPGGQQIAALNLDDDALFPAPEAMEPPKVQRLIKSEAELLRTVRPRSRVTVNRAEPVPPVGEGSEVAPPFAPFVRARPSDLEQRIARNTTEQAGANAELLRKAERSPVQIQLGAFPELSTIEQEWMRISIANSDILSGLALAVQQTISGGVTYYRLRVGPFRDGHQANTVCQALKARGYDCLVAINTEKRG
ncbi:MAG: SPOR domain-containing protein [Pseudomonadota bacterium]